MFADLLFTILIETALSLTPIPPQQENLNEQPAAEPSTYAKPDTTRASDVGAISEDAVR